MTDLDDEYGLRRGGMASFQIHRREELRRYAMGDRTVEPPATGDGILYAPDRKRPIYNRIPIPDGGNGRKPFAGKDEDE